MTPRLLPASAPARSPSWGGGVWTVTRNSAHGGGRGARLPGNRPALRIGSKFLPRSSRSEIAGGLDRAWALQTPESQLHGFCPTSLLPVKKGAGAGCAGEGDAETPR